MKPFNEVGTRKAVFKNKGDDALHGDVIITRDDAPAGFDGWPVVPDGCLAYGEATGHVHQIIGDPGAFELRECPQTKVRHLKIVAPVALKHQEHSPIMLPPGRYRIGIQREYDPFSKLIRRVAD